MNLERLRREIEALRPEPATVTALFPDGSRRTLSLEDFLAADDTADFYSLHGTDLRAVEQVLNRYAGPTVIN